MDDQVRMHYERHPYPHFSYLASVRPCDTYALNIQALWARANGTLPPPGPLNALLAGCGSFSPYPTSLANPDARITALDLSAANLRRARIHTLLHGRRNISYLQGNLLDGTTAPGPFHFIDAFDVLHHLQHPAEGLRSLERRLAPGGVVRIMVYSRQARREEESIRRALHRLGVRDVREVYTLAKRTKETSRFRDYMDSASEARHPAELADALLHPQVTTYRVDELLALMAEAGLEPLFFAHRGALPDVRDEVERMKQLEQRRDIDFNFVAYLVRPSSAPPDRPAGGSLLLNPALHRCVKRLLPGIVRIGPRLGFENPVLDGQACAFLRKFILPRPLNTLNEAERVQAEPFLRALFLVPVQ